MARTQAQLGTLRSTLSMTGYERATGSLIHLVPLAVILYLVLLPLAALVYSSLKASGSRLPFAVPGFSLANFGLVFRGAASGTVAFNTLIYVAGSLAWGLALSLALTYLLERTDLPGRSFLGAAVLSPLAVPHVVSGIAWLLLANPTNGPLSLLVRQLTGLTVDVYSLGGMIFLTGILAVPSMTLLIAPQMVRLDAALEEAAQTVGASWFQRTRRIVLPLISPALIAAGMLLVIVALEAFDVPALLGYPKNLYVFSTLIQQAVQPPNGTPNFGLASGYGVALLVLALALVFGYRRAVGAAHRFRTIGGRSRPPALVKLGRWRPLAVALVLLYVLVAVVLPLLIVLWTSLLPFYRVPDLAALASLTLANYRALLADPRIPAAAAHSLAIMLVTATATTALACWAGWVSVRRRFTASWLPVEASFLVIGVPGVVLGLSLMYLYLVLPIPIYGTVWIIVVAYVTRFLAFGVRLMDASFRQLDRELEQAGQVVGANGFTIARRIVLPLMFPAVWRGWLWVAVRSLGEVPMALLLVSNANRTLAVALWQIWTVNANYSQASALAVILAAVSVGCIWLLRRQAGAELA
ncbi:MAG TPA: iron ABC transporter permease [Chloroflexota bacterium]|nr:iron ABC transporter permease [Chloroflexota bacterium]